MTTDNVSQATIAEFGRKYLWWKPVGGQPHSEDRIIAQTMNLGTYDDILLLEQAVGKSRLVESCCTPSRAGSAIAPGSSGAGDYLLPPELRSRTRPRGGRFMPQRLSAAAPGSVAAAIRCRPAMAHYR
jgi:hypothetical protein